MDTGESRPREARKADRSQGIPESPCLYLLGVLKCPNLRATLLRMDDDADLVQTRLPCLPLAWRSLPQGVEIP